MRKIIWNRRVVFLGVFVLVVFCWFGIAITGTSLQQLFLQATPGLLLGVWLAVSAFHSRATQQESWVKLFCETGVAALILLGMTGMVTLLTILSLLTETTAQTLSTCLWLIIAGSIYFGLTVHWLLWIPYQERAYTN